MRRRRIILSGVFAALLIFIYHLFSYYYDIDPTLSPFEITVLYDWIAHRHNYQNFVHSHKTVPILSPDSVCHESLLLLIIVCSSVTNFIPRKVIRETWGRDVAQLKNSKLLFLVGGTNNSNTKSSLEREYNQHLDIIQYDFVESYHNLTIKSILLLKWVVHHCKSVQYVMKADDDIFIHVPNVIEHLTNVSNPRLLMGYRWENVEPIKHVYTKWYTPLEEYPKSVFPPYLGGPGYVMGKDAISILHRNSFHKPFVRMEDAYVTGICSEESDLILKNSDKFKYTRLTKSPCLFRKLYAAHKVEAKELYYYWKKVYDPTLFCYWWSQWFYWG